MKKSIQSILFFLTKYLCIILIIIFLIRLLYVVNNWRIKLIDSQTDKLYKSINGSSSDKDLFERYTYNIEKKKDRVTALDLYRLGSLYDFVGESLTASSASNSKNAGYYYLKSLKKIEKKYKGDYKNTTAEDKYVIEKIKDRIHLNKLYVALLQQDKPIEEQPLWQDDINWLDTHLNTIEMTPTNARTSPPRNQILLNGQQPPEQIAESEIKWISDSQNVHDSNINQELVQQYNFISSKVTIPQWSMSAIIEYISSPSNLKKMSEFDQANIPVAVNMLYYINSYNPTIGILGVRESEYISKIFTYIMQERDERKKQIMTENFVANLKDMNPNGTPVCINGRITRALSSLATPGIDSACISNSSLLFGNFENQMELGILKSGQVIKNEIMSKVGNVRDSVIRSANENSVKQYNAGEQNEETAKLHASIMEHIDVEILSDYMDTKGIDLQKIRKEISDNI